jgi:cobalt-zinc-cadmium efflux system protein
VSAGHDHGAGAHDAGAGHDHSHGAGGHNHAAGANAKMLSWALALTFTYFIAEVIGGFVFNSLALLSDAAHMMTDVMALVIALLAIKLGQKPADDKRTFGYRRFEILAAAFNAVLLFGVAIYVFVEAIKRFTPTGGSILGHADRRDDRPRREHRVDAVADGG